MGANSQQVGGDHYKGDEAANQRAAHLGLPHAPEHWDIVHIHEMDYYQGVITKYVMRHKKKRGIEDLKKAQHTLSKYIEILEAAEAAVESAEAEIQVVEPVPPIFHRKRK